MFTIPLPSDQTGFSKFLLNFKTVEDNSDFLSKKRLNGGDMETASSYLVDKSLEWSLLFLEEILVATGFFTGNLFRFIIGCLGSLLIVSRLWIMPHGGIILGCVVGIAFLFLLPVLIGVAVLTYVSILKM